METTVHTSMVCITLRISIHKHVASHEEGCWVAKPELVHFHESGKLGRAHVRCLLHKHREPDFLHVQRVASML